MSLFEAKIIFIRGLNDIDVILEDILKQAIKIIRNHYGIHVDYEVLFSPDKESTLVINGHVIKVKKIPSIKELVDLIIMLSKPMNGDLEYMSMISSRMRVSEYV
ncbi:MAG: hypothetical protein DRO40_04485 [Thermoprotei archaeon]|nr:MAG: hypothetical protein DRO40_04485 [Thermoprotei archaeon]